MKKHFLLLVMALMSMTAWAEDISVADMSVGNVKYGGSTAPGLFVVWKGETLSSTTQYNWDGKYYTTEACTTEAADPKTSTKYTISTLPVGTYYVKITGLSSGGFSGSKVGSFAVERATAILTLKTVLEKVYGAKDPAAPVKGEYTIKDAAGSDITTQFTGTLAYSYEGDNAGTHALTFTGLTNDNYALTSGEVITITAKPLTASDYTITAEQKDVVYTGNNIYGQYTIKVGDKTLVQGESTSKTADFYVAAVKNVSTTAEKPTITFFNNYKGTATPKEGFKVTPAPITVSLKKSIKVTYDNTDKADQTATAVLEYTGFVGGDIKNIATITSGFDVTKKSVKVATAAIAAGDYDLEISGITAGTSTNYEIKTFLKGQLTIDPAELTIRATDVTKAVGETDPKFTLAPVTGLIGKDYVEGVTFSREDKSEAVGKYEITANVSAAKVMRPAVAPATTPTDVTANYSFNTKTKGVLTISQGAIVVTIKNAEKFYGAKDPTFTYTVTGLQDGDELKKFDIKRDKLGEEGGENIGAYALTATVENPNSTKYTSVTVVPGIMMINKAQLLFTIPAQSIEKEKTIADLKATGITATGINNSDKIETLYALAFNTGVSLDKDGKTDKDQTVADGIKLTLTTDAAKTYEIVDKDGNIITSTGVTGKLIVGAGTPGAITLYRYSKTEIADAKNASTLPTKIIADNAGEVKNVTFGEFEMLPEKWYPLVLPFETTVGEISSAFNYAVVNVLNTANTDATKVSFKLHMGKIAANTPFVVKVYNAAATDNKVNMNTVTFKSKKIVAPSDYEAVTTADAKDASGITFLGTYAGKTDGFRANEWYFSTSAELNKFYPGNATNTTYLRPLGAWLRAETAGARVFEFEEADGTVTAIQAIAVDGPAANAEGWYTIGGVKLQGAPTKKGVYIQNGKKVIVK